MKKISMLVAALAMISTPALANFDGFYVGIQGGYSWTDGKVYENSARVGSVDPDGGLFGPYIGYAYKVNNFVLGGEFAYSFTGSADDSSSGVTFKREEEFYLSVRPGYMLNPKMLGYGILGWKITDFEYRSATRNNSDDVNGFNFGAGLAYMLTQNISIRGELSYTIFEDFKAFRSIDTVESLDELSLSAGISFSF